MPKGGNIHQHAIGAIYAEKFIQFALRDSCYINPVNYQLYYNRQSALTWRDSSAILINTLLNDQPNKRDSIIDYWSVRNYQKFNREGRNWFFNTFMKIIPAFVGHESEILTELCQKAAEENIQYIETMFGVANIEDTLLRITSEIEKNNEYDVLKSDFTLLYKKYEENGINELAKLNADSLDSFITKAKTNGIIVKYQLRGSRIRNDHLLTFGKLMLAFKTAELTDNLVGVNFGGPEDFGNALANYSYHMEMFRFLKEKHPTVNVSLHAGELVAGKGAAKEEDLKFHIFEAITIAGASRIGHGVDLLHETNKVEIISLMKKKSIAVEINLESNEVILGTNPQTHPVRYYFDNNIPICLCTDDEGILRTSLTNQYVLLLDYLPEITYQEIKRIVRNSIEYSFLNSTEKQSVLADLKVKFDLFERQF